MFTNSALAPLLAVMAAVCFGANMNLMRRGLRYVDAQTASLITIGATFSCFLVTAPFWMRAEYWSSPVLWIFALNGLMHPIFSRRMAYEATLRIGPTLSATFAATEPLFSAVLALSILGEELGPLRLMGTVLTVGGVGFLSWRTGHGQKLAQTALLFATGAALIRSLNSNLSKLALRTLPHPIMGGLVTFGVSLLEALILHGVSRRKLSLAIPLPGLIWCGISGVNSAFAVYFFLSALNLGEVVLVSPIVTTAPLFTLITALVFRQERFSPRAALGVFVVVAGVILVSRGG